VFYSVKKAIYQGSPLQHDAYAKYSAISVQSYVESSTYVPFKPTVRTEGKVRRVRNTARGRRRMQLTNQPVSYI